MEIGLRKFALTTCAFCFQHNTKPTQMCLCICKCMCVCMYACWYTSVCLCGFRYFRLKFVYKPNEVRWKGKQQHICKYICTVLTWVSPNELLDIYRRRNKFQIILMKIVKGHTHSLIWKIKYLHPLYWSCTYINCFLLELKPHLYKLLSIRAKKIRMNYYVCSKFSLMPRMLDFGGLWIDKA